MAQKEVALERIKSIKKAFNAAGIVLTPEEAFKEANKKYFKRIAKQRRKAAKKRKGGSPFLPGSFESSRR